MMITPDIIRHLLEPLNAEELIIIDQSHLHQAHYKGIKNGISHVKLKIKAASLQNISFLKAHQEIYTLLKSLIDNGLNAIEIQLEDLK